MIEQLDNTQFENLLKNCPAGIVITDRNQDISWLNETVTAWLGDKASSLLNTNIDNLDDDLKTLFTSDGTVHLPAMADGDDQWFMCSKRELDNQGHVYYFVDVGPIFLLMKERDHLRDELHEALAIDEVTGLPNKKALFQSLEPQVSRSRRYNNQLSIIVMQVNQIEQLDDEQSNQILVLVSQMLNDQIRWADIVGKLGDNEFLLVLPETSKESCKQICQNLAERVTSMPLPESIADDFKLDASFGYAEWQKGDDVGLLMLKARKMLE